MSITPMGLLERCVSYKDKVSKGLAADAGLFTYPVLMAADILIYDSEIVPVGADQIQHVEVARDIAGSFNHLFGETFTLPKYKVLESSAKVPGTDGRKMSKSYNNTIEIFEDVKPMRKKVMRITTDSRPMEQPKPDYENDHLYQLYCCLRPKLNGRKWPPLPPQQLGCAIKQPSPTRQSYFSAAQEKRAFASDAHVEAIRLALPARQKRVVLRRASRPVA
jgi:tryptophanyl-tRNA synthetase